MIFVQSQQIIVDNQFGVHVVVALLVLGSLERAENLKNALIVRGFEGKFFFAKEGIKVAEIGFLLFVIVCVLAKVGAII